MFDESTFAAGRCLATIGLKNTEENCRTERDLLYRSDIGKHISDAIMFEEILH